MHKIKLLVKKRNTVSQKSTQENANEYKSVDFENKAKYLRNTLCFLLHQYHKCGIFALEITLYLKFI